MDVFQSVGKPLDTKIVTSSDTAQLLPTAYMGATATRITATGFSRAADACLITCKTNTVRFTYNSVTPTNDAGTGMGHNLIAGASILLDSETQINGFRFISAVGGAHGVLTITPFFKGG